MFPEISEQKVKLPESILAVFQQEDYKQFLHTFCNAPEFKQAVFTFPFQQSDPLHYLNGLDAQNEFLFFNEKTSHQKTIAAGGSLKEITAAGPNRFAVIQRKIEALKSETLHLNATANAQNGFHILGRSEEHTS